MSQSEVLVGALLGAFVIFLLMTNRLGAYWALLTGGGASAASNDTPAANTSSSQTFTLSPGAKATINSIIPYLGYKPIQ